MIRKLLAVVVLLLLAGAAGSALLVRAALAPVAPGSKQEATFVVAPGDALGRVARGLERAGLVKSARAFEGLARWRGVETALKIGEYAVSPAMTPEQILNRIVAGDVRTYTVVVPEGFTAVQIAERLERRDVISAARFLDEARSADTARALGVEGDTLEGYLYPDTYRFPRGLTAREVARTFVAQFKAVWREIAPRAAERGLSMREVVTLASIVEKETGAPHERPLIAAVFLNRLRLGMRLETDPTVIYGIPDFDGNLRRRHLEDRGNPYNTYVIPALPPGPIANPGREALRAVVAPAETEYLFFVSRNDGTHVFSRTYREHNQAVNRYQR